MWPTVTEPSGFLEYHQLLRPYSEADGIVKLPQSKPSVAGLLAVFSQPSLLKQCIPAGYVDAKVPANVWPATEYLPPFLLLQSFYASLSILQRKFLLVGSLRMLAVLSFPSFFL